MIRFAAFLFALAGLAAAQNAAAETTTLQLSHQGKERTYRLFVPEAAGATQPMPLVVALHFYPGDGAGMEELSGLSEHAKREGFLVAYPDGLGGGFNALMCCGSEDDVGFIGAVVEKVSADHPVDAKRVFATGISNGGDLTYRLAAELPGVFAAIAPVSGGMTGGWIAKATGNLPTQPTSLISFIGARERFSDDFGAGVKFWLDRLGCSAQPSTLAGTNVEVRHADCRDGSSAAVYVLPDMGHAWPGAKKGGLAFTDSPIDASELIWQFFVEHPAK